MNRSPNEYSFLKLIGDNIRKARQKKGWSQEEFAFNCGLHRTYVGAVERGKRNITILNLRKIAITLGVKIYDLVQTEINE